MRVVGRLMGRKQYVHHDNHHVCQVVIDCWQRWQEEPALEFCGTYSNHGVFDTAIVTQLSSRKWHWRSLNNSFHRAGLSNQRSKVREGLHSHSPESKTTMSE